MENLIMNTALQNSVGSESVEFFVQSKRVQPIKKTLPAVIFGFIWLIFTTFFILITVIPVINGQEIDLPSRNYAHAVTSGDTGALVIFLILLFLFLVMGVLMLGVGIKTIIAKGGYFVATKTRLIEQRNGTIRSMDWKQFTKDITTKNNSNEGDITLKLRTGKMVNKKFGPPEYVAEVIYICGLPNVAEIAQKCLERIEENTETSTT